MKISVCIFAVLMGFACVGSEGFAEDGAKKNPCVVSTDEKEFALRGYYSLSSASFTISHWDQRSNTYTLDDLDYSDNPAPAGGFSVKYKGISLGYGATMGDGDDTSTLGRTKSRDYFMSLYKRKIGFEFFYQNKRGFYLSEPARHGYREGDPETIRPDVRQRNVIFNALYAFSDDFSLAAAFDQSERQAGWDWSFFIMGSCHYNGIRAERSLIPDLEDTAEKFGDQTGYRGGRYFSFGLLPGLGLTVPLYDFYAMGVFFMGPGYMHDRSESDAGRSVSDYCNLVIDGKFGAGYNGEDWFCGMFLNTHSVVADSFSSETRTGVQFCTINGELFAGIRF